MMYVNLDVNCIAIETDKAEMPNKQQKRPWLVRSLSGYTTLGFFPGFGNRKLYLFQGQSGAKNYSSSESRSWSQKKVEVIVDSLSDPV